MPLSEEDLDLMFSALSHVARRTVVKSLGEKGVLSFSQLMEAAGIEETGTFGFHLKKTEPLLEKLPDGRYKLSKLGEKAYSIMLFLEKPEAFSAPPEKPEAGVKEFRSLNRLLLDAERLSKYGKVVVKNCDEVLIDSDVSPELFRDKVLSIEDVGRIVCPKELHKAVLSRVERGYGVIETYEGELPLEEGYQYPKYLENYGELAVDVSRLRPGTRIENYGHLTLKGLTEENVGKIAGIENYGVLRVPKGFKEHVSTRITGNWGVVEEYE